MSLFLGGSESHRAASGRKAVPRVRFEGGKAVVPAIGADLSSEDIDSQLADLANQMAQTQRALSASQQKNTVKAVTPLQEAERPVPAHIAYDKKVLLFNAYFKQTVHESPDENFRVRYVKIFYYLEDDTISVIEPEIPNSGLVQGKLVHRQLLPKDDQGNTYHWTDLNVGIDITIYARVYHTYSCDQFTERFLTREGVIVNPPEDAPTDLHMLNRTIIEKPRPEAVAKNDFDRKMQFMQLDRKVLRFSGYWEQPEGSRNLSVLYYLADDTIEIREQYGKNSGRDPTKLLMKRQVVPVNHKSKPLEFASIALEMKEEELTDIITPEHLGIGRTVNFLGREILLYDCDEFTKEFYRQNFGVDDFTPLSVHTSDKEEVPKPVLKENIFGSDEDSMLSVEFVVPKTITKKYHKLYEHGNTALRFSAHLKSNQPLDADRRFIISYFLASDKLSIFEPPQRNSGLKGGKFLDAMKVKKNPRAAVPEYITENDLYVGAELVINGHVFVLDGADSFVLKFMQDNNYPQDQIDSVKNSLQDFSNN